MAEIYDWEQEGSFIYDWDSGMHEDLEEEKAHLMRESVLNWTAGTVAYVFSAAMAIDADLAFMKVAKASGAPSSKHALELATAAGLAWFGRKWRSEAHEEHVEAYELL